jgi:hypothetical protein
MDNDIAIVHDQPAVMGKPLFFPFFLVFDAHVFDDGISKRIEHTVAGTGADDKIVGKRNDAFQVDQKDVLPFLIFKGVDDFTGKFKCVQVSPHGVWIKMRKIILYKRERRVTGRS